MTITKKEQDNEMLIILEGRLDTNTAPMLEKELSDVFEKGYKNLVLDFMDLVYISSAGLRVLLSAQKNINTVVGKMTLINVSDDVKEVFDMTGFSEFLNIE